eukprot:2345882-Pleurochrysis_carterae.AAC.1
MTRIRLDISYHTSMLCRFMHNPSINCYSRAEELLNYLFSTKGMILVLGGKTISLPHFDTLRDAGAKELKHNEFAQRITGNYTPVYVIRLFSTVMTKQAYTHFASIPCSLHGEEAR